MRIFLAGVVVVVVLVAAILLTGCEAADRTAADKANAEAALERARAESYERRTQANIEAANARLERNLTLLPYILMIGGGLFLAAVGLLMFWDLRIRAAQMAADTRAREAFYLAQIQQGQLHPGETWIVRQPSDVVVYTERGRRV